MSAITRFVWSHYHVLVCALILVLEPKICVVLIAWINRGRPERGIVANVGYEEKIPPNSFKSHEKESDSTFEGLKATCGALCAPQVVPDQMPDQETKSGSQVDVGDSVPKGLPMHFWFSFYDKERVMEITFPYFCTYLFIIIYNDFSKQRSFVWPNPGWRCWSVYLAVHVC